MRSPLLVMLIGGFLTGCSVPRTAAGHPAESPDWTTVTNDPPQFVMTQVFSGQRFPNVLVTTEGTVVGIHGSKDIRARRSVDGGKTFGPEIEIANPGFHGGGAMVDEETGDLLVFVEEHHPPAPVTIYRSRDDGRTWQAEPFQIEPDTHGNVPSMHMNERGITLRHGPVKGRLIRAARFYAGGNKSEEYANHYTTAIYSDDGGRTWRTSAQFPENGTGEAAIAELSDGTLYYNSRTHWSENDRPTRRRAARSLDAGATWQDWHLVPVLPDGLQHRPYGCMGGLTRLNLRGRDILVFSNIDTPGQARARITAWASFDGGRTWPIKRLVYSGRSAYSSLAAGRPGTASAEWIYLHFEGGPGGGSQIARFNLAWLLRGEPTGDGTLPPGLAENEAGVRK